MGYGWFLQWELDGGRVLDARENVAACIEEMVCTEGKRWGCSRDRLSLEDPVLDFRRLARRLQRRGLPCSPYGALAIHLYWMIRREKHCCRSISSAEEITIDFSLSKTKYCCPIWQE